MSDNANKRAFPDQSATGLSKREYLAGMIAAGMWSDINSNYNIDIMSMSAEQAIRISKSVASCSSRQADEILKKGDNQ